MARRDTGGEARQDIETETHPRRIVSPADTRPTHFKTGRHLPITSRRRALPGPPSSRGLCEVTLNKREPKALAPIFDRTQLEDSCMGDTRLRRALAQAFLDDVRPALGRLEAAIAAEDTRTVEFDAHRLKGLCGVVGAARCAGLLGVLEVRARERSLSGAAEILVTLREEIVRVEGLIAPILDAA